LDRDSFIWISEYWIPIRILPLNPIVIKTLVKNVKGARIEIPQPREIKCHHLQRVDKKRVGSTKTFRTTEHYRNFCTFSSKIPKISFILGTDIARYYCTVHVIDNLGWDSGEKQLE
jgi:hypothetical protein